MGLEPTCLLNLIRLTSYLATLVPSQSLDLLDILPQYLILKMAERADLETARLLHLLVVFETTPLPLGLPLHGPCGKI